MLPFLLENTNMSLLAKYSQGIDHVAIAVKDLKEAVRFYTQILGLTVTEERETKGQKTGMRSAVVVGGAINFVLVEGTTPESQVSRFIAAYGPGVQHVAIRVKNLRDIVEELKDRGMMFTTSLIKSKGLLQTFSVRDENSGVMLELIERAEGLNGFFDDGVKQLFKEMEESDHF